MKRLMSEFWGRLWYLLPRYPHQAQIEITNRCNLSCAMCPRDYFKVPREDMSLELIKEIVDRLKGVPLLTLTGWGEPLMHPFIFEMISYCKGKGHQVSLTTNGVLLSREVRQKVFNSGLDALTISLDSLHGTGGAGHLNQAVPGYVKELIKERKGTIPVVTIQTTLHKGREQDVYQIIHFGKEAGVERINLGRLDIRYNRAIKRPSPREERIILKNADHLGRELGVRVDSIQYALFKGVERRVYKVLKRTLHRFGKYCLRLYDYVYINQRGEVTPCCGMPHYGVGSLLEEELKVIWQGERFKEFRKLHRRICGACDLWRIEYRGYD